MSYYHLSIVRLLEYYTMSMVITIEVNNLYGYYILSDSVTATGAC